MGIMQYKTIDIKETPHEDQASELRRLFNYSEKAETTKTTEKTSSSIEGTQAEELINIMRQLKSTNQAKIISDVADKIIEENMPNPLAMVENFWATLSTQSGLELKPEKNYGLNIIKSNNEEIILFIDDNHNSHQLNLNDEEKSFILKPFKSDLTYMKKRNIRGIAIHFKFDCSLGYPIIDQFYTNILKK